MSRRYSRQGYNTIKRLQAPKVKPPSELWMLVKELMLASALLLLAGFLIVFLASINW